VKFKRLIIVIIIIIFLDVLSLFTSSKIPENNGTKETAISAALWAMQLENDFSLTFLCVQTVIASIDVYGGLSGCWFRHSIVRHAVHKSIVSSRLDWLDPQHRPASYVNDRISLCGRRLNASAPT